MISQRQKKRKPNSTPAGDAPLCLYQKLKNYRSRKCGMKTQSKLLVCRLKPWQSLSKFPFSFFQYFFLDTKPSQVATTTTLLAKGNTAMVIEFHRIRFGYHTLDQTSLLKIFLYFTGFKYADLYFAQNIIYYACMDWDVSDYH